MAISNRVTFQFDLPLGLDLWQWKVAVRIAFEFLGKGGSDETSSTYEVISPVTSKPMAEVFCRRSAGVLHLSWSDYLDKTLSSSEMPEA